MQVIYLAFAKGDDADADERQPFEEPGDVLLIATEAVQRFCQHDVEPPFQRITHERLKTWSQQRGTGDGVIRIWIGPKEPIAPAATQGDDSETVGRREIRTQFWTGLNDFFAAQHPSLPKLDVRPNWTIRVPSGLRHVGFELRFNLKHDVVSLDVWFWRAASRPVWEKIKVAPAEYDAMLGTSWKFEPVEGRERARMYVDRSATDLRDDDTWADLYRWFGQKLDILYKQVAPKLRQELDQTDTSPSTI